jgi:hypothetical protein
MPSGINPETGMSYRFIDRSGKRNGRLVFMKHVGYTKHKHSKWLCKCDCGNETITTTPNTKSCGCLHREIAASRCRARKLDNPVSRTAEYRKAIKTKMRQNPVYVMHSRISRLHRHALSQVGAIKSSPTFESLGYTVDDFVAHIEKQFLAGMSWSNMREWQIDHIIPISTAKTKEDVVALNQLYNLRPMWAEENNAKKNKIESLV